MLINQGELLKNSMFFPVLVDGIFEDLLRFSNAELSRKTISSSTLTYQEYHPKGSDPEVI